MATLKTQGTRTTRTIEVLKDRFNPRVYVTLEIGDALVSVNRAEVLDAIGAVEPTPTPATPTVTRQDADTVLADGEVYVARSDRDIERYEGDIEYYEHKLAENRAVAKFLRAEQAEAEAQAPVNAEIAALTDAYTKAFPYSVDRDNSKVIGKLHAAGFRILP